MATSNVAYLPWENSDAGRHAGSRVVFFDGVVFGRMIDISKTSGEVAYRSVRPVLSGKDVCTVCAITIVPDSGM